MRRASITPMKMFFFAVAAHVFLFLRRAPGVRQVQAIGPDGTLLRTYPPGRAGTEAPHRV